MAKKKLSLKALEEEGFGSDLEGLFVDNSASVSKTRQEAAPKQSKAKEPQAKEPQKNEVKTHEPKEPSDDIKKKREKAEAYITEIPIESLVEYPNHPFKVRDDEEMEILVDSIRQYGNVLVPLSIREIEDDKYVILSGHRRKHAAEIVGLKTLPCIIFDVDDATADFIMVDSNAQRELTPSERAAAYKIKYEALKKQGKRSDLYRESDDIAENDEDAFDKLAKDSGLSRKQIARYIRLTELNSTLLDMVDDGELLSTTSGYILSYLPKANQLVLSDLLTRKKLKVSVKQANALRQVSKTTQTFTSELAESIITGKRGVKSAPATTKTPKFNEKTFADYYPSELAKAPTNSKISFVQDALTFYKKYIEEHPEEIDIKQIYMENNK